MIIGDLSQDEIRRRLSGASGLSLRTGPFTVTARSSMALVAEGISRLYADFPLIETPDFVDFHVAVRPPANIRRWWRPQVLFHLDDAAPFKPLPANQAFAMFEWGMNWCVSNYGHHYLILHAAVVEKNGYGAILPAPPGSGKSTLCAGLVNRGWRLLSDELTILTRDTGEIVPLARPVSLKNASLDVIRNFAPDAVLGRVARDTAKGTVGHMRPPGESVQRVGETALPGWVIFPRYVPGSDTRLREIGRGYTFLQMAENAFNYSLLGKQGFDLLGDMMDRCSCFEFEYSDLDDAVLHFDQLADAR